MRSETLLFNFHSGKIFSKTMLMLLFLTFLSINDGYSQSGETLNFDGNNDYVQVGNIMPATYTKEAWFYVSNLGLHNNLISGGSDGQHALYPSINYGNRISAGHNGIWNSVQDPTPILANTWYHVALTYDAATTTMKLYKNGVLVSTNTNVPPFVGGNALRLGSYDPGLNQLGGKLDEVRIWNRVLNQCEIQNNMNGELSAGQTGLLVYYQFNQGLNAGNNAGITSLTDSSGNNNNGTLVNFTLNGATSNWVSSGGVTTGTTSPAYILPNVNTVVNQTLCTNSATVPVVFSSSTTGRICGQINEGGNINLTAPAGAVFTAVPFASYGTPNGSCGSLTIGSCHASNSISVVSGFALNQNSFTIPASNGIFGDPCPFTAKRLYIEAVYNNTTFDWTNDAPSIGLASSGTGDIPSFTAVNTGSTPIVATITVTPSVNGCAGTPIQFTITVNPIPSAPTAAAQEFCNSATVDDLMATGTTLNWYDVAANGTALNPTTALVTGTYYVTQTTAACESPRTAVSVTITPSTTNTTTASACDSYTWAVNGTTYSATGTYSSVNGCHTETLDLTINSVATPAGNASQSFSVATLTDATIEDLVVNPTTVTWYASSSDASSGMNALPAGTQLVDGTVYYAVNSGNGCSSSPFAVSVAVTLGNVDFDSANFSIYPNPTTGSVTVKYSNEITEVSVLNLLGQTVLHKKLNATEATLDLIDLPSATYLVKVVSEGKIKTVKMIKR